MRIYRLAILCGLVPGVLCACDDQTLVDVTDGEAVAVEHGGDTRMAPDVSPAGNTATVSASAGGPATDARDTADDELASDLRPARSDSVVAGVCVCLSNADGRYCVDHPERCFPNPETCLEQIQRGFLAEVACQIGVVERRRDDVPTCAESVVSAFEACIGGLDATCPTDDFHYCVGLFVVDARRCLDEHATLDGEFDACGMGD